jgi:hypothetical protein
MEGGKDFGFLKIGLGIPKSLFQSRRVIFYKLKDYML